MSRKFVVIAPTICCNNPGLIGNIYTESTAPEGEIGPLICNLCQHENIIRRPVYTRVNFNLYVIEESLIVWLPDDEDKLRFEKENDLEGVV